MFFSSRAASKLLQRNTSLLRHRISASRATRAHATKTVDGLNVDIEHFGGEWETYGDVNHYNDGKFQIKTFNKISPVGLTKFDDGYDIVGDGEESPNAHALLLRSYKLKEEEVRHTVRAIARCGAGTNNIPVDRMTELGIPVFNTPGANANAVKELVLCGMLMGARRVVDGINHMKDLGSQGLARERVEKDKALFGGQELKGKTLAVIGLGHIGASTARDAARLGMEIVGYDPALSIESALKLPRRPSLRLTDSIASAVSAADFISLNIPYIKGEGGTHGVINQEVFDHCKRDAVLLNFARGELVDSDALKVFLDAGDGRYITDFPDDVVWDHKNAVVLPHLGASTEEAEEAAASMAADTIRTFLETGAIKNSVNFPTTSLAVRPPNSIRVSVVNKNQPGMLAKILDTFGKADLNIVQQVNLSRGDIAYNVLDVDCEYGDSGVLDFKNLQKDLTMLDGILSSRIIYGAPGTGYAKNLEGSYFA